MSADESVANANAPPLPQATALDHSSGQPRDYPHGRGLLQLDNTKAGMAAVDKQHVEKVINDMSRGSPYYANEERKAVLRRKRIARMKELSAEFDRLSTHEHREVAKRVATMVSALEDDTNRSLGVFVHLDMDAFFAAVEEKKNPSLSSVPFGVGGIGMLSTSNYLARQHGVRAGMPGYVAKKLCPDLRFVHSSFDSYREESHRVRDVIREYDRNFSSGGLDEFTLNLEPYIVARGYRSGSSTSVSPSGPPVGDGATSRVDERDEGPTPEANNKDKICDCETCPEVANRRAMLQAASEIAHEIRRRIVEATQLTASCGIAVTPCLAKIVSNYNKPNGQYLLPVYDKPSLVAFMATLPVRRVPGIGKCTEEILAGAFGIHECGALLVHRERLQYCLTPKLFEFLLEVGLGVMGAFASQWGAERKDADHASEDHAQEELAFGNGAVRPEGEGGVDEADDGSDLDKPRRPLHATPFLEPGSVSPSLVSRKTIGHERTFRPVLFPEELVQIAERNLRSAHETLMEEQLLAQQVSLKLKYTSFEVRQVSLSLASPTNDASVLGEGMHTLLGPFLGECHKFRLLGVRLGQLVSVASSGDAIGGTASTGADVGTSGGAPAARPRPSPGPSLDELFARHYRRNSAKAQERGAAASCPRTTLVTCSSSDDSDVCFDDEIVVGDNGHLRRDARRPNTKKNEEADDDDVVVVIPPVPTRQRGSQHHHNSSSGRGAGADVLGSEADVVVLS